MMSLLKKPKFNYFKENFSKSAANPIKLEIKAKNTCHIFEILFQISEKSLYDESILPIELFDTSVQEVLAINVHLKNKEQKYFNKNNEQILVNEYYQDIYTLEELKNNVQGFEWFTELGDFNQEFIKAIIDKNFELLVIKNFLLLNINISNIFGDKGICNLLIRPYLNNKFPPSYFWNLPSKNNLTKKEPYTKNTSLPKKVNNLTNISKNNIPNNNTNNILINKKRLRLRKKKDSPENVTTISISNSNSNSKSNSNIENEKSQSEFDNFVEEDLPQFEPDALAKESTIIEKTDEEALIGNAITNSSKKYRLLYRASRDGDSANKFHFICDKHSNLIVLISTKQGLRFGGFTSSKFRSTSHLKFDNNAFLFNLDNKKVFNIIPGQYAIYCYDNTGPCFSKGSLYVPNSFFSKCGKTGMKGGPFQFRKDYELNNGNEKFLIKELEVFQVKVEETPFY